MKYYENMNESEKYQIKDGNSFCRGECEKEKNGIEEGAFILSAIFFFPLKNSKALKL